MTQVINSLNFETTLKQNEVVLVDFYADWCGPCRAISETLERISSEFERQALVAKVNIDKSPELCRLFEITSIPSLLYFKNRKLMAKETGVRSHAQIAAQISKIINHNRNK
ncbi:thioredoxin [Flavobacterium cyanobacteriorum]|uniref:Thioredoxin n=1 Tax=Flavobacterium cyanobacteriorum TaxID=2022802 RepID=A0A255YY24_9FLAO|nr:thioredoxin [Flavobacterium cyanobacteriorum]OYQ34088.1 thioredoxin [Flavobacterium cyanobacteriorum]